MVDANPAAGPANLRTGTSTRPPAKDIDPSLVNQGRLKHERAKILRQHPDHTGLKGGTVPNLDNSDFIVKMQLLDQATRIITVQSP